MMISFVNVNTKFILKRRIETQRVLYIKSPDVQLKPAASQSVSRTEWNSNMTTQNFHTSYRQKPMEHKM